MGKQKLSSLVNRASHALTKRSDRLFRDELGVTKAQLEALLFIEKNPGCSGADLSRALGSTKAAISGMMSRLDRDGMIERFGSEADGRAYCLELTKAAKAALGGSGPLLRKLDRDLSRGFSASQVETITAFLSRASQPAS